MDDGSAGDIRRKRPHGGDHKDESSAKRRIVVDLERLGQLAVAAIAEDSGKYRRAIMYMEGKAGSGLDQAARDVEAVRLLTESNTPDAKYFLAGMYKEGRAGLGLVNQAARDVEAVRLLTESNTPGAKHKLARMYMEGRAGLGLVNQAERDAEVARLLGYNVVLPK